MILTLFVISIALTINPISITLYTSRNQPQEESTKSKIETSQPSYVNVWLPNGTVICTASNDQYNPQICSDGGGGAIITWQDNRSGNINIYAQKVDSTGKPIWEIEGIAINKAITDQFDPQICSDGAGGAIITWQDNRSGNWDIYAQWVSSTGKPIWEINDIAICREKNDQYYPQICNDGAEGAIITWRDYRSGSNWDIYAQLVYQKGGVQWTPNGIAICTASYNQYNPQICGDGAGGAIITWHDSRSFPYFDIYAQKVDSTGNVQWTANGTAICTASYYQRNPQICSDGVGGAIITWYAYKRMENLGIYAQRVDSTGNVQWMGNGTVLCAPNNAQVDPQICSDGAGGAIITWQDYRSESNRDIYAQKVDPDGDVLWTDHGVAICTAINDQFDPQLCGDGAGGAFITWRDYRSGSNFDIYAQKVDEIGNMQLMGNGTVICTASNNQYRPQICSDGAGGAIITWEDWRSGKNSDIYAQRIKDHPLIIIKLPINNQLCNKTEPSFNIEIVESNLDTMWYTIDGGITIITFTTNDTIDQTEWNKKVNGTVTIEFYANDTFGNIGSAEVTIHKDIEAPNITINNPDPDQEFKLSAPLYDLSILEGNLDKIWYTLDGGATNISITELSGKIDQTIWEGISDGPVTIRFYASDTLGHLGSDQVEVQKDTKDGQDGIALIIRNAIIYSTVVGVIGSTFWIIRRRMGKKKDKEATIGNT